MQYLKRKARPVVKWHGGKAYMARLIVEMLPEHATYVEPYAGGINVLLNKPKSAVEVISDTNPHLINLYKVIQDPVQFEIFMRLLRTVKYSRDVFDISRALCPPVPVAGSEVQNALLFLVKHRMSVGGRGTGFAWSTRCRGGIPGDANAWKTSLPSLEVTHDRLRGVRIQLALAMDVVAKYDGPETAIYLDPPYPKGTRTATQAYGPNEMTDEQHEDLLKVVVGLKAKAVLLSTYWNPLYESYLRPAGWDYTLKDIANHSASGGVKQRRTEVIWFRI